MALWVAAGFVVVGLLWLAWAVWLVVHAQRLDGLFSASIFVVAFGVLAQRGLRR